MPFYRSSQIWPFEWKLGPPVVPLGLAVLPLASVATRWLGPTALLLRQNMLTGTAAEFWRYNRCELLPAVLAADPLAVPPICLVPEIGRASCRERVCLYV